MTALNLGDASRVLAPPSAAFSMVAFGDVDLIPADDPHPVDMWGEWPRIPRATSAGASMLTSDAAITPSEHFAAFVAVTGPTVGGGSWDVFASPPFALGLKPSVLAWARAHGWNIADNDALSEATDAGVTVFAITNGATASRAANSRQGTIVTETPFTGAYSNSVYVYPASEDDPNAGILGIWYFDDVDVSETDMLDTIGAIEAMFAAPPGAIGVTGAGGWGIGGAGAVSAGSDELDPPDIDAPPVGGTQIPPDAPDPATPSEMAAAGVYPIRHVWEVLPEPTIVDGRPVDWTPTSSGNSPYAYLQIVVEGVDITLYNGVETPFPSWRRGQPFGAQSATIALPQVTTFHPIPTWAKHGANVSIRLDIIDGDTVSLFEGFVVDLGRREDAGVFTLEASGVMFGADLAIRPPALTTKPQDIGALIPKLLNALPGRRYSTCSKVTTGISTSMAGGWEPLLTGYIQELLATATDSSQHQWTVACDVRTPVLANKNTTTIATTIRTGQRGIDIDLNSDATMAANVIYGEGVNARGGRWRNAKYPNWNPDNTPAYPNSSPSNHITQGERDANTDSGRGISDFERKLGLDDDGYYSASDVAEVKRFQKRAGITVDGVVGPQTWAAIFGTGSNTGSLDGAFIAPLAAAEEVMPRLYGPDGDDLGANPNYDPDVVRVERKIAYGTGMFRWRARIDAERVLKRESVPGWFGIISFELDPAEMSKYELREGMNIRVLGWHGETVDVHVVTVRYDETIVTCEVDSKARDYPTLQALMTRDREAIDPAKVARKRILYGEIETDRPEFDEESPAGRVPRHAVNGGLWDVVRIPLGEFGTVTKTSWYTDNPTTYSLAVFVKQVTAAQLNSWVGNPLTATSNPWEDSSLEGKGLLMAWGWRDQPGGYWPHSYWNHKGTTGASVTGRLWDDMSFDYASLQSPWVWVAMYAAADTYAWGRLYGIAGD